jgi:hypothetical protein
LQIASSHSIKDKSGSASLFHLRRARLFGVALSLAALLLPSVSAIAAQTSISPPESALPEAPQPQSPPAPKPAPPEPCRAKRFGSAFVDAGAAAAIASDPSNPVLDHALQPGSCPPFAPFINWYARFLTGPGVKPMTPREKARLAARNVIDPFTAVTILGVAGISVAANSHSAYGPGMPGYGRYVGVSYTQDITGEFFGTFLIPSIAHQDPHYHRMPGASIQRRIAHAIYQVVWTQGDNGEGMLNYADLVGFAVDDAIGNLYVPGQRTNLPSSTERYVTGLATAPIDNFVTEFLPDVARRIHIHDVLIQRIINQVARTDNNAQ